MSSKKKQDFKTITLDGEALYLRPWENQKGERYGPTDHDRYDVTLVNLDKANMEKAIDNGRNPTMAKRGSSKFEAGFKEYYKFSSLFKIPFVDSKTTDLPEGTLVGNGSKIRVYLEVREIDEEYQQGNTHKFYCTGVQLLEMKEMPDDPNYDGGSGGAKFESVDGGYVAPETNTAGFTEVSPDEDPITDDEIPF